MSMWLKTGPWKTVTTDSCAFPWVWAAFCFPGSALQKQHRERWGCRGQPTHTPGSSQALLLVAFSPAFSTEKKQQSLTTLQVTCTVREKKAEDKMCNYSEHCFIYISGETPAVCGSNSKLFWSTICIAREALLSLRCAEWPRLLSRLYLRYLDVWAQTRPLLIF